MVRIGNVLIWLVLFWVTTQNLGAGQVPPPSTSNPNDTVTGTGGNVTGGSPNTSGGNVTGGPPNTSGGVYGGTPPPYATNSETAAALAREIAQAPSFALASGIASIIGLLLTLYATQVRTIPFSLYRSLMWRKALLLSIGVGLLIFGVMKFHAQEQSPFLSPFRELHGFLFGYVLVSPIDNEPHGTFIWAVIAIVGVVLVAFGVIYDPAVRARRVLIREQDALHKALDVQISHLMGGRKATELEPPDSRVLRDTLEYYRHVQWRFADVVLGAPPPTFPLFFGQRQRIRVDDTFEAASADSEV